MGLGFGFGVHRDLCVSVRVCVCVCVCVCLYVVNDIEFLFGRSKLNTYYVHCVTDDKKEDSLSAMSCVEACQQEFVSTVWINAVEQPAVPKYTAITDGAGCYTALHQLLMRIRLSHKTGVYIVAYFIPETGFNKTALDGRFATDSKGVMAHVRSGADAYDATTLFWALAAMGTGKNVVTLLVETNREAHFPPKKKITDFLIRQMASKRFLWVPRTEANRVTQCSNLLKETLLDRKFVVSKVNQLLRHYEVRAGGKKAAKVDALVQHLAGRVQKETSKGWTSAEVVDHILKMETIRPTEDDNGCCRQWIRAWNTISNHQQPPSDVCSLALLTWLRSLPGDAGNGESCRDVIVTRLLHFRFAVTDTSLRLWIRACNATGSHQQPSRDVASLILLTWLHSLPEGTDTDDSCRGEIVDKLMRFRFVAPKLKKSGLMLQSVTFRRHSGIGSGHTKTATQLESLWGLPYDHTMCTGVRVIRNSRHCGMVNAPIQKQHKSKVVRTRASKIEQRVEKAKRVKCRELQQQRLHLDKKAALRAKKLLSDGFWCRHSGCTRFFQFARTRLTHERRGDQCSGGVTCFRISPTLTNRDTDKCLMINQAIAEAHTAGRLRLRVQRQRSVLLGEDTCQTPAVTGEYTSCVTGGIYVVSPAVRGSLRKVSIAHPPIDDVQMKFLMWAWNVGEVNRKKKLSSRQTAKLMKLHGTAEGQRLYVQAHSPPPPLSLYICLSHTHARARTGTRT